MRFDKQRALVGAAVVAGYSAWFVIFFLPQWLNGRPIAPNHGASYYYPAVHSPLSLWTPLLFSGYPVFGDPQNMTYYPLARVFALLPNGWNALVLSAYVLAA